MFDRILGWIADREWALILVAAVGVLAGILFMLLVLDAISPYRH